MLKCSDGVQDCIGGGRGALYRITLHHSLRQSPTTTKSLLSAPLTTLSLSLFALCPTSLLVPQYTTSDPEPA
eukprot:264495-Rhodomonas_salina.1